jgi:glutamine amidotransferase-like uncharacterized protein
MGLNKEVQMKKTLIFLITLVLSLNIAVPPLHAQKEETIKVGVFNGFGASEGCITDTMEALKIDPAIIPVEISASDILSGHLEEIDVLVFAGGSGSRQKSNLGDLAGQKVMEFVRKNGKGVVGICAGAYLLSDTPDYACLHLFPVQATDIEHDARGNGIIAFSVNKKGLEIFPELKNFKKCYVHYYEGPLCIPAKHNPKPYNELAVIISDVHLKEGAPAGMTPGKPLFLNATVGKSRIFLSVGHPETTPGMRWTVPRMVRWTVKKELVPYPADVVRPDIYTKEILFDKKLREQETDLFNTLRYGDSKAKINALKQLVDLHSWTARYWFPGLLRDKDPEVRLAAAKALADIEYTSAIDDLKIVTTLEKDKHYKKELSKYLDRLTRMVTRTN